VNREDDAVERLPFDGELLPAGRSEGVVAGSAVVLGRAPFGFNPNAFRKFGCS
jgi:hypothetical protein